ncbi:alpha/beta hydrolase [Amorphoplanes nipponensis]|uniref:Hydrolase n=1 Tax=Actinoplanes nipponensis TaxID=135950 RepID=A0A919MID4_9ACTN|nr:alpha/beta hydrolase [Actinoplanes nipponensis]GIE50629.1 hydrolase [Actinoplanes nipponensis]
MRLQTTQGALAYDDTGHGPLVVCLPGMGDNRTTYRHLVPLLVAAGHRVVTVDPRGQGESDAVWPDYSPEAIGADLLELLRHLDAGPALLVTNSYTGATAVWAAAEAPDAFSGLVLIAPFAREMPPLNAMMRLAFAAVGRFRPLWLAYWSSLFKTRRPDDLAAARARLSRQLAEPGRMAALRAMGTAGKAACEARFPEVSTPALVVMGTRDPDFPAPREEAELIAGRLGGRVVMIEGAGHYPQTEYPAETAAAIRTLSTGSGPAAGEVTTIAE